MTRNHSSSGRPAYDIIFDRKLRKVNTQPNDKFQDLMNTKPKLDSVQFCDINLSPTVQSQIKKGGHQAAIMTNAVQQDNIASNGVDNKQVSSTLLIEFSLDNSIWKDNSKYSKKK